MKKKYILTLLLFFILVIGSYYISHQSVLDAKEVLPVSKLKSNCVIQEINEQTDAYVIKIFYPETKYQNLNEKVMNDLQNQIQNFKEKAVSYDSNINMKYQLMINFDSYEYQDHISYLFNVFVDTGGAHPNTYSFSVNYHTTSKKMITLSDLMIKNPTLLTKFSQISYEELKENEQIKEYGDKDMLKEGTAAKSENFQTFVFDKSGLKIIFDRYSVAPYVAGAFFVMVPYEQLNL